ncbi:hypothetical protein AWENTII_008910 [Aspergillus wentii]
MDNLPSEILLEIYKYIDDFSDRRNILLICRGWRDLFSSEIYSDLTLRIDREQFEGFVRSLRQNPALSAAIYDLRVDGLGFDEDEDCWGADGYDDILQKITTDQEELERWKGDLRKATGDAWMAIIFTLLPNLQRFKAEYGDYPTTWIIRVLSQVATRSVTFDHCPTGMPLQNLQEVEIEHGDCHCSFPASEFFPFFLLPAMRVFEAGAIYEQADDELHYDAEDYPPPKPSPGSSSIKKLILNSTTGYHGMADYITACAGLEHFQYEHRCLAVNDALYYAWRPQLIHDALLTQTHSLELLWVSNDSCADIFYEYDDVEEDPDEMWFGSLVEFECLREVCMPLRILLDFRHGDQPTVSLDEVLPDSLEHFRLEDVQERDYPIAVNGLNAMLLRRPDFPLLEGIELQTYGKEGEAFAGVKEICEAEGVKLCMV